MKKFTVTWYDAKAKHGFNLRIEETSPEAALDTALDYAYTDFKTGITRRGLPEDIKVYDGAFIRPRLHPESLVLEMGHPA